MSTVPLWPGRPTRIWPESAVFKTCVASGAWAVEPKLDGWRALVAWGKRTVTSWTRHGKALRLSPSVQKALEQIALPPGTIIDGELLGPRQAGAEQAFFAFDVPILGGVYDRTGTYDERRAWLEASGLPVVDLLPCRPSSFEAAVAAGHEGLVLKRRDSVYPFAASDIGPETVAWLKCKASTTDGRVRR